jgi:fluoride exporter
MGEQWKHPRARTLLHDGLAIGFCGGLTTFSTLAVETASLLDSQHWATGLIYLFGSLSIAIASAVAGAALVRRVNALRLPLEGER